MSSGSKKKNTVCELPLWWNRRQDPLLHSFVSPPTTLDSAENKDIPAITLGL